MPRLRLSSLTRSYSIFVRLRNIFVLWRQLHDDKTRLQVLITDWRALSIVILLLLLLLAIIITRKHCIHLIGNASYAKRKNTATIHKCILSND